MLRSLNLMTILLLCSCSVRENRDVCPCALSVRAAESLKTDGDVLVTVVQDGVVAAEGSFSRERFDAGLCVLNVPRRQSVVTVFSGITGMRKDGGRQLEIGLERDCDEIYSCSCRTSPSSDSLECIVTPHKNYANLNLEMSGMPEGADICIVGGVQGYDLITMEPLQGPFRCIPEAAEGEPGAGTIAYRLRLPRQLDDSLCLNVTVGDSLFRSVSLGRVIADSGYSFDEPDLPDINVYIDLSKLSLYLEVAGWEVITYSLLDY